MERRRRARWLPCLAAFLAACSSGVGGNSSPSGAGAVTEYTVGGSVSGLRGSGLVLENNGTDDIAVAATGAFTFKTPLVPGDTYSITVRSQPDAPTQTCTVKNGSGTVTSADITDLALVCVAKTTTTDVIGGTVEGLLGAGLVLQNNFGDGLEVAANGAFTFATPLPAGTAYAVSVLSPPLSPYQDCAIANGAGTTGANDVLDVSITCKSNPNPAYTVGGTVTGLVNGSTLVLLDNGRDSLKIAANGAFHFALPIPSGSSYSVSASGATGQQSQACAIGKAAGTMPAADVTNVSVACTQNAYVVATISGLPAGFSLVLQNNGTDPMTVTKNGTYTFPAAVPSGSPYAVSIAQQPPYLTHQQCAVQNGGGAALPGVNPVSVVCPPPVLASIEVTPAVPSLAKGVSLAFTATGIMSDQTTTNLTSQATWASSNAAVATVSNAAGANGLASAVGVGATTITASSGAVSGSTLLTVTPATLTAIQVTPATASVAKGVSAQFTATGVYSDHSTQNITTQVTWSSSNAAAASISNAAGSNGLASTVGVGTTTITASSGTVAATATLTVTAATLTSIGVTPANPSIASGFTQQFTATGVYSDSSTQNLTTQVTWSSSNGAAATISNTNGSNGLATTTGVGTTTIAAASGGLAGSTTLHVTAAILTAIAVTPATDSVPKGVNPQFTATGTFSDHSTRDLTAQVVWSPSDAAVATISNAAGSNGLATSVAIGNTTITATSGEILGTAALTVTPAALVSIAVTPAAPTGYFNAASDLQQPLQFVATGTYTDQSHQVITSQVTWTPSDPAVATVSNIAGSNGLATPAGVGTETITAASGTVSNSTPLTVVAVALQSIQVAPATASVPAGLTQQFTATGTYNNGATGQPVAVLWGTGDQGVATISNAFESNGLATTVAPGTTTITATSGTVVGTATLNVTAPILVSIQPTALDTTLCVPPYQTYFTHQTTQTYTAIGTYSDLTQAPTQAAWSSSDTTSATITPDSGLTTAVAAAVAPGSPIISATSGGITGTVTLTVSNCTIVIG